MYEHLIGIGAIPKENPHIDMCADIPNDGSIIFEMKSGGENLIDQIRKGVSQLYEYRYRYKNEFAAFPSLCLVLPNNPQTIPWIEDYLCNDREITMCWFDENDQVVPSELSKPMLEVMLP